MKASTSIIILSKMIDSFLASYIFLTLIRSLMTFFLVTV